MTDDRKSVWLDADGMPADPPEGRPEETMAEISPAEEEGLFRLVIHEPGKEPLVFEKLEPLEVHRTLDGQGIYTTSRPETDRALRDIGLEGADDLVYRNAENRMPGEFIGSFKTPTAMHCYSYFRLYAAKEGEEFYLFVLPSPLDFFDGTDPDNFWDYKPAAYMVSFGSREEAIEWAYENFETDTEWDLKQVLLVRWLREKEKRNN